MVGRLLHNIVKTKKLLLVMVAVFLSAGTLGLFSPWGAPVAHAELSANQRKECYDLFNGKNYTEQPGGYKSSPCFTDAERFCSAEDPIVCKNPNPDPNSVDEAIQRAKAAEIAPLITIVCGAEPASNQGPGAAQRYTDCSTNVEIIYDDCSYSGSDPYNNPQNNAQTTANCATPRLNAIDLVGNTTNANVTTAITTGRQASQKIIKQASDARAQKECTDSGGTWTDGSCTREVQTVCAGGALGWILCPLAALFNNATALVAEQLQEWLTFKPLLVGDNGAALKAIWSVVLNIANILLVIVFMVVVFSQATSVGLSAYGIKKLLPKLVAAAILINLSFYICAFGIDVSNILGQSVKGIIDAGFSVISQTDGFKNANIDVGSDPRFWASVYVNYLIGSIALLIAAATASLPLLLPVVVAAAVAFITAWFVIGMRIVLLTLLVVVSPLAFVAWVLPNTANLFTRWRKLFVGLLMMYPFIMAIFYGAALVSAIVLAS